MKKTIKMMALLFSVATIAVCAISCENKAKKEADEAAKQEILLKQQEEAQREEARREEARREEARQEQERIAQERAKNLITTPPKSVSDLRERIIGTRWKVEHSDGIYPVFEFDGSKVREYLMHGGNKTLNNENTYTIREDTHSDCYLIEFGDNYDLLNLKKIFMFVKGTNAVVLYEPQTGARDNLQLLN